VQLERAGIYINENSLKKLGIKTPPEFSRIVEKY